MFDETAQKVVDVIASTQKLEPGKVTLESTFEELQIDSLDGLNIVFALENEFNLDIPDDQAKELRTVRQAAERIHALIENRASGNGPATAESA
ncbi:MAG: acyl carrier protein [Bryobacterales bacterium]|nr:acyl carrier protein [Bryobacterales bacterium]